jgi:hypothetical protein
MTTLVYKMGQTLENYFSPPMVCVPKDHSDVTVLSYPTGITTSLYLMNHERVHYCYCHLTPPAMNYELPLKPPCTTIPSNTPLPGRTTAPGDLPAGKIGG